jgi:IS1 family transposase
LCLDVIESIEFIEDERGTDGRVVELYKKKRSVDAVDVKERHGRTWIWTALDVNSRLIVCYFIGDRILKDARSFLSDLKSRCKEKPLFVSDELPHYEDGLKELYHNKVKPELTGRRGRPRKALKIVDAELDYATVHKTRENGRVVKVEQKIVFGQPKRIGRKLAESPSNKINTAYVERSNLSLRLWNAHLTRKTLTFAKSINWLKSKFALVVGFYNFVRTHSSLKERIEGVLHLKTPAMAAGITDHPWSIGELLKFNLSCQ